MVSVAATALDVSVTLDDVLAVELLIDVSVALDEVLAVEVLTGLVRDTGCREVFPDVLLAGLVTETACRVLASMNIAGGI